MFSIRSYLFNLCVTDMSGIVDNCECFQYAIIYLIFVLLTRQALSIIVNVYKMQLFNLCVADMSGIVDNCECFQSTVIYLIFVLLICQVLSTIVNVFNTQLFI